MRALTFLKNPMFKRTCSQIHWLLGLSAGLVLALMGITGGIYGFADELIAYADPQITKVRPTAGGTLPAPVLLARISASHPHVSSLTLSADPSAAARVGFMTPVPGSSQKKFSMQYMNPYTGELLGKPDTEEFFRTVLKLHRQLALDEPGEAVTGAATLALLFLLVSGMYLRWPKTDRRNWKVWLGLDWHRKGRSFLSSLHAVFATWLMLAYLLAALTGLAWSYDWYRHGLNALAGVNKIAATQPAERSRTAATAPMNLDLVWQSFSAAVPRYQKLILLLPGSPAQPVQILYLDPQAPHPYANNRLLINATSGELQQHDLYADKTAGEKFMTSLYALHSASYFGFAGRLVMTLCSLLMPVLAISGWMMYLRRRSAKNSQAAHSGYLVL